MEALLAVERELDAELRSSGGGESPAVSPQKLPSALVDGLESAGGGDPGSPEPPSDDDDDASAPSEGAAPADSAERPAMALVAVPAGTAAAPVPFHADKKKSTTLKKIKKLFGKKDKGSKEGVTGAAASVQKQQQSQERPLPPARGGSGGGSSSVAAAGPFAAQSAQLEAQAGGGSAIERQSSQHSQVSQQSSQQQQHSQQQLQAPSSARAWQRWSMQHPASEGSRGAVEEAGDEAASSAGALVVYGTSGGVLPGSGATPLPPYPPSRYSSGRFELAGSGRYDSAGLGDDGGSSVVSAYDSRMGTLNSNASGSRAGTIKGLLGPRKKRNKQIELDALRWVPQCASWRQLIWPLREQLIAQSSWGVGLAAQARHNWCLRAAAWRRAAAAWVERSRGLLPCTISLHLRTTHPAHMRCAAFSHHRMEMEMLQERCSVAENGLSSASHDVSALRTDRDALQQQVGGLNSTCGRVQMCACLASMLHGLCSAAR
jgi:hypothetical protein